MADDRDHIRGVRRIPAARWPDTPNGQIAAAAQYIEGLLRAYSEHGGPIDNVYITIKPTFDGHIAFTVAGDKGRR